MTGGGAPGNMDEGGLREWFSSLRRELEDSYLRHSEPWRQSGFSGPEERWAACRRPIADCIEAPGSFLDIGCANGYLLECVLRWTQERGITVTPFGLDLSERLVRLARQRLPEHEGNLFVGNAWSWQSPLRFDYVRTEVAYVPEHLERPYIERILGSYLTDGGRLLVAEYRSRKDPGGRPWVDSTLRDWGLRVTGQRSGFWEGRELTRVAVVVR